MLEQLRGSVIPDDVQVRITRNYGETANEKVNSLVEGLGMAIVTVIGLIALVMNWRVGLIVATAVPITYALTLFMNFVLGYTINRVTLFALILTLGLLVDDPIVGVENIYRHLGMKKQPRLDAILVAMNEVLPPIVIATLAIVVAFIPMFFITGMMGPYMRPMAINVPLAMLSSMLVSLVITPWISNKLLGEVGSGHDTHDSETTPTYRVYRRVILPFIESRKKAWGLLAVMGGLFAFSILLAATGLVPLKMLPFDNKNEFQLVVDMPESATLERTDAVVRELEDYLRTMPEVTDFTSTVGAGSPMDFNGLVRHYYLRQGPNLADVRVNLLRRHNRAMDSHSITLRIRRDIEALAAKTGAKIKIVETPPGPPVFATVVAEVYGRPHHRYDELIAASRTVKQAMAQTKGVVDVDDMVEENQREMFFRVDREKAGMNGVSTEDIVQTLQIALGGMPAGVVHVPTEQNELPIILRLPRESRSDTARLSAIAVKGRMGQSVQLGELGRFEEKIYDKTIFHKNMERVVYVTGEMAGRGPAYAVLEPELAFRQATPAAGHPAGLARRGRVEDHGGRLPRPRDRLLGRADRHLRPARLRNRVVRDAAADHALDPADTDRHHARLLVVERAHEPAGRRVRQPGVFHRDGDDRHDRAGGHRGPERHHPDRFHPKGGRERHATGSSHRGVGRGPVPADFPDRGRGDARRMADHAGPDLQRPGLVADLRAVRVDHVHAAGDPDGVQADLWKKGIVLLLVIALESRMATRTRNDLKYSMRSGK